VAVWCPYGMCVGFHIRPQAEGRNDIFSALFTRWEKPLRTVIYDFACQLATYCRIREAAFFKDTLFVIDQFHSNDHTSCSEACFLNPYMQQDPSLRMINSSAAECGNAGLGNIRKMVSYATQSTAIAVNYLYPSLRNRQSIIKHFLRTPLFHNPRAQSGLDQTPVETGALLWTKVEHQSNGKCPILETVPNQKDGQIETGR